MRLKAWLASTVPIDSSRILRASKTGLLTQQAPAGAPPAAPDGTQKLCLIPSETPVLVALRPAPW